MSSDVRHPEFFARNVVCLSAHAIDCLRRGGSIRILVGEEAEKGIARLIAEMPPEERRKNREFWAQVDAGLRRL